MPMSTTSKPAPSIIMDTRFLPISWISPLTVPMTIFPIGFTPVSASSGRRIPMPRSTIADNNSFEQWEQDGSLDAAQRANGIWKRMLKEYEAPPLDPAIDEALLAFIERRKSEFEDREY